MDERSSVAPAERRGQKRAGLLIVLAGIALGQVILYGPSLAGRKILLPLDILAQPLAYISRTPETESIQARNTYLVDLVFAFEPMRRFAASEFRAGRLPMWAPYHFGGAPFIWPKFSPFLALQCLTESPLVLAWTQLLASMIAGVGSYLFFRSVLALSFWLSAIASWCYPLTAFFVLWQGYPTVLAVYWLPWILLAVHKTVRRANSWTPLGLSVVTCFVIISGHLDVAAQVLLVSVLYAAWCWVDAWRGQWFQAQAGRALLPLLAGWLFGFLLAAPYVLPVLEYTHTSARMVRRSAGEEERPPVGLAVLPEVVLPEMYGSTETGSFYIFPKGQTNLSESTAATYTGAMATLFLAPLAFCSRRHRSINALWAFLIILGLSWCLNVPGIVSLLRLPGLRIMSHDRLVFASSFAILALAATGLEILIQGAVKWRKWFWLPFAILVALFFWCVYRTAFLPERLDTQIIHGWEGARQAQAWFTQHYAAAAVCCSLGIGGWLFLWLKTGALPSQPGAISNRSAGFRASQDRAAFEGFCGMQNLRSDRLTKMPPWLLPFLAAVMMADLLWFDFGKNPQCARSLYYPPVPVLQQVAKSAPGRIIGYSCLPPALSAICGLQDIRGYDGVDPARLIDLLNLVNDPQSPPAPSYASTQWEAPKLAISPEGDASLPPVLNMLGVRYVIFRGSPPPGARPAFQDTDYWVLLNPSALPRVFVPQRVEVLTDPALRLEKLASAQFDPRAVAYAESPVKLPETCRGSAEIAQETSTRLKVSLHMETAGLLILADLWDKGWRAFLDGTPVPILRANHAVRGVVVSSDSKTLEFRYHPASFALGLKLATLAAALLLGWTIVIFGNYRSTKPTDGGQH
jgi:hypothetical protein